jgi:hypothetical protein
MSGRFEELVGNAILGMDTLWGGDVLCASGTGRFIADSWFSDEPLPLAYTHPVAARVRASGGVSAKTPDRKAIQEYLAAVDILPFIRALNVEAAGMGGPRGAYLAGLALCFEAMWDLAMEILDLGAPVPYERCVRASTGQAPEPSDPSSKRERVAELLARVGFPSRNTEQLLTAVDGWRSALAVPMAAVKTLGTMAIGYFDALTARHVAPHLPVELHPVPRANIQFLPIRDAWFSGSMNYLGRARGAD